MPILYFKVLHLIGVFFLFIGFGGLFAVGNSKKIDRLVSMFHGIGLIVLFIAGFGMIGMGKYGFPIWIILKMVLWVGMAITFVMTKKGKIPMVPGLIASVVLGGVVAWLCIVGRTVPSLM